MREPLYLKKLTAGTEYWYDRTPRTNELLEPRPRKRKVEYRSSCQKCRLPLSEKMSGDPPKKYLICPKNHRTKIHED